MMNRWLKLFAAGVVFVGWATPVVSEVLIKSYGRPYPCLQGGKKPPSFWSMASVKEFVVPENGSIKPTERVFGYYGKPSIPNRACDKSVNTLQFMKIVPRKELKSRLYQRLSWIGLGLGGMLLASLNLTRLSLDKKMPYSLASFIAIGALGGFALVTNRLWAILCDPIRQVKNSDEIMRQLYAKSCLSRLLLMEPNSTGSEVFSIDNVIKNYVVVTHTEVNNHLRDYMFYWDPSDAGCFLIYNADHTQLLENHGKEKE